MKHSWIFLTYLLQKTNITNVEHAQIVRSGGVTLHYPEGVYKYSKFIFLTSVHIYPLKSVNPLNVKCCKNNDYQVLCGARTDK